MIKHLLPFLFLYLTYHAIGQCGITVDAGPDQEICTPGGMVQLNGIVTGNYLQVEWSPVTGLSNPNILNPTANVTSTITYTLKVLAKSNNNLIFNGDFEMGNTGFTTEYVVGTTSCFGLGYLDCEGTYDVINNPQLGHANFSPCGDHTTGSGNMMVVNGDTDPGKEVWCQMVTVMPNTYYDFSAWLANVNPASPAQLQFSINGITLGNPCFCLRPMQLGTLQRSLVFRWQYQH